ANERQAAGDEFTAPVGMRDMMPPQPLPPIAFRSPPAASPDPLDSTEIAPPAPMPPRFFMRVGPAFETPDGPAAEEAPASRETVAPQSPVDAVLSEIDAE